MTVFICLLVLACLNLGLGYGLAVYLGRSPATMPDEMPIARPSFPPAAGMPAYAASGEVAVGAVSVAYSREEAAEVDLPQPEQPAEAKPTPAAPPKKRRTISEQEKRAAAAEVAAALGMSLQRSVSSTAIAPPPPESPSEPRSPEPSPAPAARASGAFQQSIHGFQETVSDFAARLTALEQQFREQAGGNDPQKLQDALDDICRANDHYLRGQAEAVEQIAREGQQAGAAGETLAGSLEEQNRQVQTAQLELQQIGFEENLEQGVEQALGQTAKIANANCTARDLLAEALFELAEQEGRDEELDDDARIDSLTGVLSKSGMRAALGRDWNPEQGEPEEGDEATMTIAMVDIDRFQDFNLALGTAAGDQVLVHLADRIQQEIPAAEFVARYSGGTFAVGWRGVPARNTTVEIERVRQATESTRFVLGGKSESITVSCSIVQSVADDTRTTLFERALQTMHEARRYGRNRTFLNEADHPAPVLPPNLTIEEQVVELKK